MTNSLDDLIAHVLEKMKAFSKQMSASVPSIICDVDAFSTDAFLLRSFVSLRAENDGDELAVTVCFTRPTPANTVSIDCDICMEDGTIIAAGPSRRLAPVNNLASWRKEFDEFLKASEPRVTELLKGMIEAHQLQLKPARAPGIC